MRYQFEFRPYQRKFKRSLSTSHGIWEVREGIILRLTDETGKFGFGEIAPLSWFGSETLQQALDFCRQLPPEITVETIFTIPNEFPACQFGFESAWETLTNPPQIPQSRQNSLTYSALLPTGEAALQTWQTLWNQGYRTFKWKIGVAPIQDELKLCDRLIRSLPTSEASRICKRPNPPTPFPLAKPALSAQQEGGEIFSPPLLGEGVGGEVSSTSAKLRLDANGGLTYANAMKWLQVCDNLGGIIEFIEQPLPVGDFAGMLELSDRHSTPLALDESVGAIAHIQTAYQNGWRGIFVIKPSIVGSPSQLRKFCRDRKIDAVFSSVFETEIGRKAALQLAAEIQTPQNRAVGFGINHWFDDDESGIDKLWQTP